VPATASEPPAAVTPEVAPRTPPATVAVPPATPPPAASPVAPRRSSDLAREDRLETLKRWVGYIPEVRLGKAVARWVKSQPPAGPLPPPEAMPTQAR
jgi:hypothetical protein